LISGAGCSKDFLEEKNPSNRTTDTYYVDAAGFESLVTSCYPLLRDIAQQRVLDFAGTDVFAAAGPGAIYFNQPNPTGSVYDQYDIRLNASLAELQTLWDYLYREINRCNTVISRSPDIKDMSDSLKNIRIGEAEFLRSFCLFKAVEEWGDVPMPLVETTVASLVVTKTASKDIYTPNKRILAVPHRALPNFYWPGFTSPADGILTMPWVAALLILPVRFSCVTRSFLPVYTRWRQTGITYGHYIISTPTKKPPVEPAL